MDEYYYLKKGDVIQEGDEVEMSEWPDEPKWVKTNCVGQQAPDPQFPAHRVYRRLINNQQLNH